MIYVKAAPCVEIQRGLSIKAVRFRGLKQYDDGIYGIIRTEIESDDDASLI